MPTILAIIETSAGKVRETSLETLRAASDLAEGGDVVALVLGNGVADVASDVAARGVSRTLCVDSPALDRYTTDGYTKAIEAAVEAVHPQAVLFAGTTTGRDLGPYLATRAGTTALSDCTTLRWQDGKLTGVRPVYQSKMLTEASVDAAPCAFAVIRGGAYAAPDAGGSGSVEPFAVEISDSDLRVTLKSVAEKPAGGSNLEGADTVVVGGRGVGSQENFALIEDLAAALDAPIGATRAVTDLGWRPHFEQIGQTGKVVHPKLYIGVGVSGAVQHTVGMQGSETVVAINRDKDAPLFKLASIGVVGDLNEIVPALTREIKAARGK